MLIYIMSCIAPLVLNAQQPEEMQGLNIDSVIITGNKQTIAIHNNTDGTISWEMNTMQNMPQILGNANPLHYLQMLPGIQTNSEYRGGINVQGGENSHNIISINGTPLYNVNHLLGFFSTFNSSHYSTMTLAESPQTALHPCRIGANLEMESMDSVPAQIGGDLQIGLIASQGTMRIPFNKSSALTISARTSYINMFYGEWLKADKSKLKYEFYDLNATYINHFDRNNLISIDTYHGIDEATISENRYLSDMKDKWGNAMVSLKWLHHNTDKNLDISTSIYATTYKNRLNLNILQEQYMLNARVTDLGFRHNSSVKQWDYIVETIWHNIKPQTPEGTNYHNTTYANTPAINAMETSVGGDYLCRTSDKSTLTIGLRNNIYKTKHRCYFSADPTARIDFWTNDIHTSFSYSIRHQYMFQTGFSDIGLPTESWFGAGTHTHPQYAHCFNTSTEAPLFDNRYILKLSIYYKRLYNQLEYGGTALDLVNTDFDMMNQMLHGNGNNYGINIMLSKTSGKLTGWFSYAYGRAKRSYSSRTGKRQTYPANHERPHEINIMATYTHSNHWNFGTTLVACSGTPFTAPRSIFVMNGNIISDFASHNSNRLKPYYRLDASANYQWKGRNGLGHKINLSIYNLSCHDNELFHYMRTESNGNIYYRAVGFVSPILPSISYLIQI